MGNPEEVAKRPALFWRVHDLVVNVCSVAALSGILVFMVLGIVTRYVFNNPLQWTEELTRNCCVWLTFIGAVVMIRERASICIDAVTNLFPNPAQKAIWYFTTLLCLVFFTILTYYGCKFVGKNLSIHSLVTGFNMGFVYSVIPVSGVLMAVNTIRMVKEAPEWKF